VASDPAPAIAGQQPVSTPRPIAENSQAASAAPESPAPTLGTLLAALALLGILTSATLFAAQMWRRRSDVLNVNLEGRGMPTTERQEVPYAEDAPSFAPLPPMSPLARNDDDDIEQTLRRFAQRLQGNSA
jgi:hypothetical protein